MKKERWKIAMALAISLVILMAMNGVAGALLEEKSMEEMTNEASTILIGKVTDLSSQWVEGKIFTYVTISVEQYIKGEPSVTEITIKVPGGTVGEISSATSDAPTFEKGEEVLLFLNLRGKYFEVVGGHQGKYSIENGKVLGTDNSVDEFVGQIKEIMKRPSSHDLYGTTKSQKFIIGAVIAVVCVAVVVFLFAWHKKKRLS